MWPYLSMKFCIFQCTRWSKSEKCLTAAQFKNSLLLYAVQTVEMVDIFIVDTALKGCPLCRSQYGCWSTTSVETSVYGVIYMQLDMMTVQGVFIDNVGASEALLQLPEHMKLNPLLCGWVSPLLETRIRGPCLVEDRGAQRLKAASVEAVLLMDGPPGRGSVIMADIQHNVWVILLSW